MNYISAHLWERGGMEEQMRISLVLQQAQIKKKAVLLACVCQSDNEGKIGVMEGGYFSEGLVEWFHKEGVLCFEKGVLHEIEKGLRNEVEKLLEELEKFIEKNGRVPALHFWGILLWESDFWIFSKGNCEGYLLNRRFQKKNISSIKLSKKMQEMNWLQGKVQHKLGILICTAGFLANLEKEEIVEVLIPNGEVSEERLQKRLTELWKESSKRGNDKSVGAVYLRSL